MIDQLVKWKQQVEVESRGYARAREHQAERKSLESKILLKSRRANFKQSNWHSDKTYICWAKDRETKKASK